MNLRANIRILCTVVLVLLLCLKESVALFFNKTSHIELKPFNISKGFTLTFKTCDGGTLLQQEGASTDYFKLYVVPGSMNYTSLHFTPSTLVLEWRTASTNDSVHVGNELDQSKPYYVSFLPGVNNSRNTTLSVSIIGTTKLSTVHIADSILDIVSHGNMTLGRGFIGCIDFGPAFNIQMDSLKNVSISEKCPLNVNNVITSCEKKDCPSGFKGYYCEENINECASLPCHHASKCVDRVANYTCECGVGWYGPNCDELREQKLCQKKPCGGRGICHHISNFNNYTCTCEVPYTGRNCSKIMDPCESNPCFHNGTCRNITAAYYECDCHQGFGGRRCDVDIDDCAAVDCGRGTCIDGISNHSCNCSGTGYNGINCENDINECDSTPCDHNGTCSNYGGGFTCKCIVGYSGKNCLNNIDDCASRPCKNGGNCTDFFNDFSCHCPPGFSGKSCEATLDPCNVDKNCSACDSYPCHHGKCNCTCSLYAMHYNCTCNIGYRGVNCNDDINECEENGIVCYNNGTCENQEGGFHCKCQEDYVGQYCNETKSICHPNPCEHGNCSNLTAVNYNCSCFPGWQGDNCTEDVDECSLGKDRCNRTTTSTCRNTNGSYICECASGYEGRFCDDDINECILLPCKGGDCKNEPAGTYSCFCSPGYFGKNCSKLIEYCILLHGHKKCKNGTCKDLLLDYECLCYVGWKGAHCDIDINECDLGFCKNNARCNNTLGNYSCTCQPGYTGFDCSTDIDECSSNPCKHNGVCKNIVNGYVCNCSLGYEGQSCEFEIDWCNVTRYNGTSKPCTSQGNCTSRLLNHTCDCFVGFEGRNCTIDLDECEKKPCQNEATCVEKSNDTAIAFFFGRNKTVYPPNERGGYLCICMPGYNGTNCENDIDECELYKPCNSTGTKMCNHTIDDYNCTCNPGFSGPRCSTDINECASKPCLHNGTCLDLPGTFSCNCTTNFTGDHCESLVHPCTARQPCRNGGTCTPQGHNFTCTCAAGFAGDTCDDETTLGFDGTTSMTLRIGEASTLNVSLGFRTIFPNGVLLSESAKWTLALKSGKLEVTWLNSVLFVLGSEGVFSGSRWHSVSLVVNKVSISASVGNTTCVQRCSNKADIPLARAAALSSGTQLVVGGTPGTSEQSGFIGSIRDLAVNDVTYYPGVSGVNATNVITGFQRRNVCSSEPCGSHGTCKDLWTKYECVCYRNWTGRNCTEDVQGGTFGVISRLNNGYISKGKESYAKYSLSTSFNTLAFSVRTRSSSSVVILLYLNTSVYLSVETSNGVLQLRNKGGVIGKTGAMKVNDESVHYVNINRNAIQIDNASYDVTVPPLAIQDVFVGGVEEGYLSGALGAMAPYRGCIRDVRLNGQQLLFFNQTAGQWNRTQKNVAVNCSGEDVCGKLSGNETCLNNGNCTDLWNLHRCDCPWPYGGDNCELYGCEWTNPCPGNATCVNLKKTSEYDCIAKATLNGSQSIVSFTNSTPLSNAQSLVAQFRTRQNRSSILLVSSANSSSFEITIQNGRLVVSSNLKENVTETVKTNVFVSDGQWHELNLQSNANETKFSISTMELLGSQTKYSNTTTMLRNTSVLNQAFSNLVATAGVHLGSPSNNTTGVYLIGCLREVRIGDQLLSLAANLTTRDTKPGFTRAESAFGVRHLENVTYGCLGNPVCTDPVCGAGKCVDQWNAFSCACPTGYGGRFCERDPCSSSPCNNNGSCTVNGDGTFKCACPSSYGGTRCDDPCASTPCENGGTCAKSTNGFNCSCASGWSGEFCTTAEPRESDDDHAMIIGLSVAGVCLLLIIIIAICLCTRQTSSTFGTYSPRGEEKLGVRVEMSPVLNVPPPEKLI